MSGRGRCPLTNDVEGSPNRCLGTVQYQFFDYNVHLWTACVFVALFGLSTILHIVQGVRSRRWWLLGTIVLCGVSETLGWSGRLWASKSVQWISSNGGYWASSRTAFLMQISTLIFAPAFLMAMAYICLGRIINALGPQYCRFNSTTYTITFVIGDFASLTVQAIGGGLASAATTLDAANRGARIMVGGVIVQMIIMLLYTTLLFDFVWHYSKQRSVHQLRIRKTKELAIVPEGSIAPAVEHRVKILLAALLFADLLVFVRSVYRVIELLAGWHGPIISNETLFVVLDALVIFLSQAVFNVIHPGSYLPATTPMSSTNSETANEKVGPPLDSPQSEAM